MRFGGHETFTIREGWLHKGLKLLTKNPDLLLDEYVADRLGVPFEAIEVVQGDSDRIARGRGTGAEPRRGFSSRPSSPSCSPRSQTFETNGQVVS